MRSIFTNIESIEGISYDYKPQKQSVCVELELMCGEPDENIVILYNAREVARFTQRRVSVSVDCDGVFQVRNNTSEELVLDVKCNEAESVIVNSHNIPGGITTFCLLEI